MALLWKMICDLGDPMSLRHPVPLKWVEILQIQLKASYGSSLTYMGVATVSRID